MGGPSRNPATQRVPLRRSGLAVHRARERAPRHGLVPNRSTLSTTSGGDAGLFVRADLAVFAVAILQALGLATTPGSAHKRKRAVGGVITTVAKADARSPRATRIPGAATFIAAAAGSRIDRNSALAEIARDGLAIFGATAAHSVGSGFQFGGRRADESLAAVQVTVGLDAARSFGLPLATWCGDAREKEAAERRECQPRAKP